MSRHHPYAGYDDPQSSGFGGAGHRKNGPSGRHSSRGSFGASNGWGNRRGGHGGSRSNWEGEVGPDRGYSDFSGFDQDVPVAPRGGGRGGKTRGARGKAKAQMPRTDAAERELTIDERIQRERPCRTLFVRNVKYETNPMEVREKFEHMGEIKTFFDLISNRGMVFITYFDIRAATMAKERLQGSDVSGRPIDVHYSLPKDNELERRCDRDKNQATLFLAISGANRMIDDEELRDKFSIYGEIRSIKRFKDSPYQRFVEFWDSRACEQAHDELVGSQYLGGKLDLKFSWDTGMVPKTRLPRDMRGTDHSNDGHMGAFEDHHYDHGYGHGNGQMPRQGRNSLHHDPINNEHHFESGHNHENYHMSEFGQEFQNPSRTRGPTGSNAIGTDLHNNSGAYNHSMRVGDSYPTTSSLPPNHNQTFAGGLPLAPGIPGESGETRLNQAQRVQDLLASLTKVGTLIPPAKASAPMAATLSGASVSPNSGYLSSVPMSATTSQTAYGSNVPASVATNNYMATYPFYPGIQGNEYQSPSSALAANSRVLANSDHGQLANLAAQVSSVNPHYQSPLLSSAPGVPASLYGSMANQTQPSQTAQPAVLDSATNSAHGQLNPAILALLAQTSAANPMRPSDLSNSLSHGLGPTAGYTQPNPSIPTAPRAMQANTGQLAASDTHHRSAGPGSLGISNGACVESSSADPKAVTTLPAQAAGIRNGAPSVIPTPASSSQAAVQQLLALLQHQQHQQK